MLSGLILVTSAAIASWAGGPLGRSVPLCPPRPHSGASLPPRRLDRGAATLPCSGVCCVSFMYWPLHFTPYRVSCVICCFE